MIQTPHPSDLKVWALKVYLFCLYFLLYITIFYLVTAYRITDWFIFLSWNISAYTAHIFLLAHLSTSSPEHEVLMVSYCYRSLSVVCASCICASCVNFWLVNTLEATVLVQSSSNLLRMIILTISQSSSNMGHVGSKTRSVGQIKEKPCEHSSFGGHLDQVRIWVMLGQIWSKS